ncbi:MAG: AAA family ATPase [Chromatiaceae bacterium]|nr:AAA family ATPase [Chromatiaceae bacterium]
MRIEQIRFRNLNSLVGEWTLDLTHAAFAADGLFAITGPTGAGKSTILDAICLALYGATPRLDRITQSANDILSRHSGDCLAEVVFSTAEGRWRAHWSQHRARRRASGALQAPRHEVSEADTGRLLDSRARNTGARIEALTGMDFARFTRSMLLAQGGFAAFLQATPDERAPLLEQITGTELYSQISKAVFERHRDERARLAEQQAKLAGIRPLDEAARAELHEQLGVRQAQDAELRGQIEQTRAALAWRERLDGLEAEQRAIEQERVGLDERQQAFAPEAERLSRARLALTLAAEGAGLEALRREQTNDGERLEEARAQLPRLEQAIEGARIALNQASDLHAQRAAEQEQGRERLREVRTLDLRCQSQDEAMAQTQAALDAERAQLAALESEERDEHARLTALVPELEQLRAEHAQHPEDARLVEELAVIGARLETLTRLDQALAGAREERTRAEQRLHEVKHQRLQAETCLTATKVALDQARGERCQTEDRLSEALDHRPLEVWREEVAQARTRALHLEQLLELAERHAETARQIGTLGQTQERLDADLARIAEQRQVAAAQLQQQENAVQALERERLERARILGFAEARRQLEPDTPCPLCGARHHPFIEQGLELPDESTKALETAQRARQAAREQLDNLRLAEATSLQERARLDPERVELARRLERERERLAQIGQTLELALPSAQAWEELPAQVVAWQAQQREVTTRLEQQLVQAELLRVALEEAREREQRARDLLDEQERAQREQAQTLAMAEQHLEHRRGQVQGLERERTAAETLARGLLDPYGLTTLDSEPPQRLLAVLEARRAAWLEREHGIQRLEREAEHLNLSRTQRAPRLHQAREQCRTLQERLSTQSGERHRLREQRHALLGELDPDQEEQRLGTQLDEARQRLEEAHAQLQQQQGAEAQLLQRIADLKQSMGARAESLARVQAAFRERLAAKGFSDESEHAAALLPEAEYQALEAQARALGEEAAALARRASLCLEQLESTRALALSEASREQLGERLQALSEEHEALQQALGALRQQVEEDAARQRQQAEQRAAIAAQERECARWEPLNALIGSHDGKKYRLFAQGLTFEVLVGHANRQLRAMTDRYQLIRDPEQPLELRVVDQWQGGEHRTTRNLSGGESFLVSLALALGLSRMNSRRMRLDSLFLDEGFGTLDEDTLDTALEALAGLRREGTLIGVISHVPQLRERIATRIEVVPQSGGRSLIKGPGCTRASEPTSA